MKKLYDFIDEQMDAINTLKAECRMPALLMVIYATIDVLCYVTSFPFDTFAKKYLLNTLTGLTAADLKGARNAILHTNTPKSSQSDKGKARKILYTCGKKDLNKLKQARQKTSNPKDYIAIRVESLIKSLKIGAESLLQETQRNKKLASQCLKNMKEFYVFKI